MSDMIEAISEAVHKAYCNNVLKRTGEPYWTEGDYSKLNDETKQIDRDTVNAVIGELTKFGYSKTAETRKATLDRVREIIADYLFTNNPNLKGLMEAIDKLEGEE